MYTDFKKIIFFLTLFFAQSVFAASFIDDFSQASDYVADQGVVISGGMARLQESSLWDGLEGLWRMDESSGDIIDYSGNGNNGTNYGASYGEEGKLGKALELDGVDDYIEFAPLSSGGKTVALWFYNNNAITATEGKGNILTHGTDSVQNTIALSSASSYATDETVTILDHTDVYTRTYIRDTIPVGWHQLVFQWDDTESKYFIWLDGVKPTNYAGTAGHVDRVMSFSAFRLGKDYNAKFSGKFDEVAIWNRPLTDEEITELYNAGNGKRVVHYQEGAYTVHKQEGNHDDQLIAFTQFLTERGVEEGSLAFQLSQDGTNWKYWDGNAWVDADTTQRNDETTINDHIADFPHDTKTIYVKTFLISDGMQQVEIDTIQIDYEQNNPPTAIQLSNTEVLEGTASGTSIATLTTTDADTTDTHSYLLVAGEGSEDNNLFTIEGDQLKLNFTPDYENPLDQGDTPENNTYAIRIQTNDGNGGTYEQAFIITIRDLDENLPVISLLGDSTITLTVGDSYTDPGATAFDQEDGDISTSIQVTGTVDTTTPGTYTLTYTVQDSAGNQAVPVTRIIIVEEKKKTVSHKTKRLSREEVAAIFGTASQDTSTTEPQDDTSTSPRCTLQLTRLLKRGMQGEDIKQLQHCLNTLGYSAGPEDGIFGPQTYQGVLSFQQAMQLRSVDGVVGKETAQALGTSLFQGENNFSLREKLLWKVIGNPDNLSREMINQYIHTLQTIIDRLEKLL